MLSLPVISLSCLLVQAQVSPPPGAPDPPGWLPEGKRIRCANWFPNDPCFYKETYQSQCFEPYDWKRMQYPPGFGAIYAVDPLQTYENVSLPMISSVQDRAIDLTWAGDLSSMYSVLRGALGGAGDNDNSVLEDGSVNFKEQELEPQFAKPNPPCCQWTQSCFDWVASHPPGYTFDGNNNAEEYYKMICCLVSWAAKCGGSVPFIPRKIRAPPECTMPWGHERVHKWDL